MLFLPVIYRLGGGEGGRVWRREDDDFGGIGGWKLENARLVGKSGPPVAIRSGRTGRWLGPCKPAPHQPQPALQPPYDLVEPSRSKAAKHAVRAQAHSDSWGIFEPATHSPGRMGTCDHTKSPFHSMSYHQFASARIVHTVLVRRISSCFLYEPCRSRDEHNVTASVAPLHNSPTPRRSAKVWKALRGCDGVESWVARERPVVCGSIRCRRSRICTGPCAPNQPVES